MNIELVERKYFVVCSRCIVIGQFSDVNDAVDLWLKHEGEMAGTSPKHRCQAIPMDVESKFEKELIK